MHKVEFLTKNIQEDDPNYKVVTDRTAEFKTFRGAMEFIKNIRSRFSGKEVVVGKPSLTESA